MVRLLTLNLMMSYIKYRGTGWPFTLSMIISCRDKYEKGGKRISYCDKFSIDNYRMHTGKVFNLVYNHNLTTAHRKWFFFDRSCRRETNSGTLENLSRGSMFKEGNACSNRRDSNKLGSWVCGGIWRRSTWSRNSTAHPLYKAPMLKIRSGGGTGHPTDISFHRTFIQPVRLK